MPGGAIRLICLFRYLFVCLFRLLEFLINALSSNEWSVSRAAKSVRMQRTNFYRLIKKHDIEIPKAERDKQKDNEIDKST